MAAARSVGGARHHDAAHRAWQSAAAPHATLADIAHYAYVAHAPEGKASLDPYPQVRAWLGRIEALPRFVPMRRTPA